MFIWDTRVRVNRLNYYFFRTREEFDASHVLTSVHCSKFRGRWSSVIIQKLLSKFNHIVFYDHDGTSAANIQSSIFETSKMLVDAGVSIFPLFGKICQKLWQFSFIPI